MIVESCAMFEGLHPMQVRYQAALRSDTKQHFDLIAKFAFQDLRITQQFRCNSRLLPAFPDDSNHKVPTNSRPVFIGRSDVDALREWWRSPNLKPQIWCGREK